MLAPRSLTLNTNRAKGLATRYSHVRERTWGDGWAHTETPVEVSPTATAIGFRPLRQLGRLHPPLHRLRRGVRVQRDCILTGVQHAAVRYTHLKLRRDILHRCSWPRSNGHALLRHERCCRLRHCHCWHTRRGRSHLRSLRPHSVPACALRVPHARRNRCRVRASRHFGCILCCLLLRCPLQSTPALR